MAEWNSEDLVAAFERAFECITERHTADGVTSVAVFSPRRQYRYFLSRIWSPARPPCVVCMCNPSTADAFKNDPTVARMVGFARAWGCGGLIVLNVFARRATDPAEVIAARDPEGSHNAATVSATICRVRQRFGDRAIYVAAWGALAAKICRATRRSSITVVQRLFAAEGVTLRALAISKEGHPKHPLYLPKSSVLIDYVTP